MTEMTDDQKITAIVAAIIHQAKMRSAKFEPKEETVRESIETADAIIRQAKSCF